MQLFQSTSHVLTFPLLPLLFTALDIESLVTHLDWWGNRQFKCLDIRPVIKGIFESRESGSCPLAPNHYFMQLFLDIRKHMAISTSWKYILLRKVRNPITTTKWKCSILVESFSWFCSLEQAVSFDVFLPLSVCKLLWQAECSPLWGLNEVIHVKRLVPCRAHNNDNYYFFFPY